jgi:hypothetical protein
MSAASQRQRETRAPISLSSRFGSAAASLGAAFGAAFSAGALRVFGFVVIGVRLFGYAALRVC